MWHYYSTWHSYSTACNEHILGGYLRVQEAHEYFITTVLLRRCMHREWISVLTCVLERHMDTLLLLCRWIPDLLYYWCVLTLEFERHMNTLLLLCPWIPALLCYSCVLTREFEGQIQSRAKCHVNTSLLLCGYSTRLVHYSAVLVHYIPASSRGTWIHQYHWWATVLH